MSSVMAIWSGSNILWTIFGWMSSLQLPVNSTTMSDAKDKIPFVCPSVYHSIIANPKFEQASERPGQSFATAAMGLQRALDSRKDAHRLF